MSPETKKHLILGGGLIVAVVLGIIVYKKFQANSQTSQAANDQASQDELAYIESMALDGGGYSDYSSGAAGSSVTIPSAPATQSLADEINSIEQAVGFGAGTASGGTAGTSSSGSSSSGASGATPTAPLRKTSSSNAILDGTFSEPSPEYVLAGGTPDVWEALNEPVGSEGSHLA